MSGVQLAAAVSKMLEVLAELSPEDQQRVLQAVVVLLGKESAIAPPSTVEANSKKEDQDPVARPASAWIQKNSISADRISEFIHLEPGSAHVIAIPPALPKSDGVLWVYLLTGFASYLITGSGDISDEEARKSCQHFGCYDFTNHARYTRNFGNKILGSKSAGWKLTAPGLAAIAELLGGGK